MLLLPNYADSSKTVVNKVLMLLAVNVEYARRWYMRSFIDELPINNYDRSLKVQQKVKSSKTRHYKSRCTDHNKTSAQFLMCKLKQH